MLESEWGKVIVQMKYVSLDINFTLREAELHHISVGNTSPDNNICFSSRACRASLFSQVSHLHILTAESRVLYNILSF